MVSAVHMYVILICKYQSALGKIIIEKKICVEATILYPLCAREEHPVPGLAASVCFCWRFYLFPLHSF